MNLHTTCISPLTLILDSLVGMFSRSNSTKYSVCLTCFMCIIIIIQPSILSIDRFILKPPYMLEYQSVNTLTMCSCLSLSHHKGSNVHVMYVYMCPYCTVYSYIHGQLCSMLYISVNSQTDFLHIVSLCISNSYILHLISYNCVSNICTFEIPVHD